MGFHTEPKGYTKTAMSDLQGAWGNLRESVTEHWPFPGCDRLLIHIDEAMSWESVRNLSNMRKALLLVRNIAAQNDVSDEITEAIEMVDDAFTEAVDELGES